MWLAARVAVLPVVAAPAVMATIVAALDAIGSGIEATVNPIALVPSAMGGAMVAFGREVPRALMVFLAQAISTRFDPIGTRLSARVVVAGSRLCRMQGQQGSSGQQAGHKDFGEA